MGKILNKKQMKFTLVAGLLGTSAAVNISDVPVEDEDLLAEAQIMEEQCQKMDEIAEDSLIGVDEEDTKKNTIKLIKTHTPNISTRPKNKLMLRTNIFSRLKPSASVLSTST